MRLGGDRVGTFGFRLQPRRLLDQHRQQFDGIKVRRWRREAGGPKNAKQL
jgi:hypothetical protein